jgi:hypothetical protein
VFIFSVRFSDNFSLNCKTAKCKTAKCKSRPEFSIDAGTTFTFYIQRFAVLRFLVKFIDYPDRTTILKLKYEGFSSH